MRLPVLRTAPTARASTTEAPATDGPPATASSVRVESSCLTAGRRPPRSHVRRSCDACGGDLGSDAVLGGDAAALLGLDEGVVVTLVLVGVRLGELDQGPVEGVT